MPLRRVLVPVVLALSALTAAAPVTAQAAPTPFPTRVFHGTGDSVVHMAIGHRSVLVILTSASPAGVQLQSLSKGDVAGSYLVAETYAYSGTRPLLNDSYRGHTGFVIHTAGAWTLKVKPITAAPLWRKGVVNGHGAMVFRVSPTLSGLTPARLRFWGNGNFIVTPVVRGAEDGSVINYLGTQTSKKVLLPVGTSYVSVDADGTWRLSR